MSEQKADRRKIYNDLVNLYSGLFQKKTQAAIQKDVGEEWAKIKISKDDNLPTRN